MDYWKKIIEDAMAPKHAIINLSEAFWSRPDIENNWLQNYEELNDELSNMIHDRQRGAAKIQKNKNVKEIIRQMNEQYGTVRLVIGGQRPHTVVDEGAAPFVYDAYYQGGAQRVRPSDFSINVDLCANPDLWGDPADVKTMRRFASNSIDEVLFEATQFLVASSAGDCSIKLNKQVLKTEIGEGNKPNSNDIIPITKYASYRNHPFDRKGLNCWRHVYRVLKTDGKLSMNAAGVTQCTMSTVGQMVNAAKKAGLVVDRVTLTISLEYDTVIRVKIDKNDTVEEIFLDNSSSSAKKKQYTCKNKWSWGDLDNDYYSKSRRAKKPAGTINSQDVLGNFGGCHIEAHKPDLQKEMQEVMDKVGATF